MTGVEKDFWTEFGRLYDLLLNAGYSIQTFAANPNSDSPVYGVKLYADMFSVMGSEVAGECHDQDTLLDAMRVAAEKAGLKVPDGASPCGRI